MCPIISGFLLKVLPQTVSSHRHRKQQAWWTGRLICRRILMETDMKSLVPNGRIGSCCRTRRQQVSTRECSSSTQTFSVRASSISFSSPFTHEVVSPFIISLTLSSSYDEIACCVRRNRAHSWWWTGLLLDRCLFPGTLSHMLLSHLK